MNNHTPTPPEPPFRLYSDVLPLKDENTPNFLSTRANKMRVKPATTCPQTMPVVARRPSLPEGMPSNTLTDNHFMGK